jgi:DNA-binding NarL/FixJ family response regulator
MIRVALADDQVMIRSGLRMIVEAEADLCVVGEAGDGAEAVELAQRAAADVMLMDVRMPRLDGIEAASRIAALGIPTKILMLTTFDLDDYVYAALRAGASGFMLKDAPAEQLLEGIRVVAAGDALLAPSVTRRLIEHVVRAPSASTTMPAGFADLTERELDVLRLVARGMSNSEIAGGLYLGEATVKTHVGRIFSKLGLRDRVQAVVLAYECGLVTPGQADQSSG